MSIDFHTFAKEHALDVDTYPHADRGLALYRRGVRRLKFAWICVAAVVAFNICVSIWAPESTVMKRVTAGIEILAFAWIVFTCMTWLRYAIVTVKRWRSFERQCLASDIRAESLRKRLLRALSVKRRLKEANQALSSGSGDRLNLGAEDKVSALRALKGLKVRVNTRQALDSDELERRYRIIIDIPFIQSEADELSKITKDLDKVATRLERGKVSFGSMTIAPDRSRMQFADAIAVPDKYHREDGVIVVETASEYAFPLSLFTDRRAEIAAVKDKAQEWANRSSEALNQLLATKEAAAKPLKVSVGNSNALFTYELSFRVELQNFDRMAEQFDQVFRTSGCAVSIENGNLLITIPLPKALSVPIDVPSMYREAFGPDELALEDAA